MNLKALGIILILGIIFLAGSSLYDNLDSWLQTKLNGPEYCFKDITQSQISAAAQGVSVSYTKTEGNELCFRTKDSSIVERLNQQIQDRKLESQLAQIEANKQFNNETLPIIILIVAVTLIVIVIIISLPNRNNQWRYSF